MALIASTACKNVVGLLEKDIFTEQDLEQAKRKGKELYEWFTSKDPDDSLY